MILFPCEKTMNDVNNNDVSNTNDFFILFFLFQNYEFIKNTKRLCHGVINRFTKCFMNYFVGYFNKEFILFM